MRTLLLAAVGLSALAAAAVPAGAQAVRGAKVSGQYICVFKKNVSRNEVESLAQASVRPLGGAVERVYTRGLRGFAARLPDALAARLSESNSNIAFCEQDQIISLVPPREDGRNANARRRPGSGGTTSGEETPWGIVRVKGGKAGTYGTAWVIDTGVDLDHPDLFVDVARARTFVSGTTNADDQNGHGTHVAGTIAAKLNGIGVIGVAPGARIVPVRVLDRNGSGYTSGVIAGVDYVAANGRPGEVANMSLGGGISSALDQAVIEAAATGVRFALAAGNEADNAANHSPARANGPNIFTVSAFSNGDKWASFSNYGAGVDFAEPGVSIKSTWKGGTYYTISGTSMAAPHLAGLLLAGQILAPKTVLYDPDGKPDPIGERPAL